MSPSDSQVRPDSPSDATDALDIGDVLDGRYRIDAHLATGGFGHVHAARDLEADRRVALKVLRTDSASRDPRAGARMRQEAEILRALDHPNLVTVYDVVTREDGDYMVMELLEGRTLDDILEREGPAGPERVAPVARQILSALAALHERDVKHRDIKPSNIVLVPDDSSDENRQQAGGAGGRETAKLVDFGIAKAQDFLDDDHEEAGFTLVETRGDGFVGTPRYASPEQAVGDPTVPSSDLFSLGLVLVEWFTGEPVIDDSKTKGVISLLIQPEPIDVSDCPSDWQPWLTRMVAKTPQERFSTARQAIDAMPGETPGHSRFEADSDPTEGPAPSSRSAIPADRMKTQLYEADEPTSEAPPSPSPPSESPELAARPDPPRTNKPPAADSTPRPAASQSRAPSAAEESTSLTPKEPNDPDDVDTSAIVLTILAAGFFLFSLVVFLSTVFG